MDAILIASECVESRQRSLKPDMLCKLDMRKTYGHLNQKFPIQHSEFLNFNQQNSKWFFPSQWGLMQGTPLSPFLFILAMEGMSNMLNATKLRGLI